jgi:hypothetical protein
MNELDLLGKLGERTRLASEPNVDVVASVIQEIGQRPAGVIDRRLSGVSICACAMSALVVLVTWSAGPKADTLGALSEAASKSTGPEAVLEVLAP